MERIGKAAMLVVLGYTYLWAGLRAAVTTTVLSGIGWARLLAKRVHTRWKPEIPACLVSFRAALGPGMIAIAAPGSQHPAGRLCRPGTSVGYL